MWNVRDLVCCNYLAQSALAGNFGVVYVKIADANSVSPAAKTIIFDRENLSPSQRGRRK